MPVFESIRDASDPTGEAILARALFATEEAREAAVARGRRMAEGENPFAVGPAARSPDQARGDGPVDGTLTTFAA